MSLDGLVVPSPDVGLSNGGFGVAATNIRSLSMYTSNPEYVAVDYTRSLLVTVAVQ
jgi:hypothetical protein